MKMNQLQRYKHIKRIALLLLCILFLVTCSSTKNVSSDESNSEMKEIVRQDGSSYEKAIIVKSIKAEYEWLAENYLGYKMIMQELREYKKKPYDILTVKTADGIKREIYFDISSFFGKGFQMKPKLHYQWLKNLLGVEYL